MKVNIEGELTLEKLRDWFHETYGDSVPPPLHAKIEMTKEQVDLYWKLSQPVKPVYMGITIDTVEE